MSYRFRNSAAKFLIFGILLVFMSDLSGSAGAMEVSEIETGVPAPEIFNGSDVANGYGRVIFHRDGQKQKQIYIIAQNHRSSLTGRNSKKTLQAQMEIFRIGEWLIRQHKVELLLPEGYFGAGSRLNNGGEIDSGPWVQHELPVSPDDATLWKQLTDDHSFFDAARLLYSEYDIPLAQVEDKDLYRAVANSFHQLAVEKEAQDPALVNRLLCFQERRTAAILQKIPSVVDNEYGPGIIQNKRCLFIIGMAHIAEIIHFLEEERIELTPLPEDIEKIEPCELSLLKEDYGITIILPRSLAEDEEALRLTKLLKMVTAH